MSADPSILRHVAYQAVRTKAKDEAREREHQARRDEYIARVRSEKDLADIRERMEQEKQRAQTSLLNAEWRVKHGLAIMQRLVDGLVPCSIADELTRSPEPRDAGEGWCWYGANPIARDITTKTLEDNGASGVTWTPDGDDDGLWEVRFRWAPIGVAQ